MFVLLSRRTSRLVLVALCLLFAGAAAFAGETFSKTFEAQNYPGSQDRQYQIYVPDGLSTPASMVMALHGCQQTQTDVLNDWGLKAAADRHGFILVAPFITSYDGLRNTNCWGFWLDQHQQEGQGEPEDLYRIAQAVEQEFSVDPDRRYITGLSSGGAMTVVAATTHNEYWAAAASASGLPYGEDAASVSLSGQCPGFATFHPVSQVVADMRGELDDPYPIPLMVLQNDNDCTVVQPAGRNLRDAHLAVFGDKAHDTPTEAQTSESACLPFFQQDYACRQRRYTGSDETRSLVETIFYDGPLRTQSPGDTDKGHYWIGGEAGNQGRWAIRAGPSYPDIIWDFFARHPRDGASPPPSNDAPRITLNGADPLMVPLNAPYNDPGAIAEDPQDGALEVSADCSAVDTSQVGDYACNYTATDSDGNTTTASRTVRVFEIPAASCDSVSDSPRGHIDAGRAVEGGFFGLRALAKTDRRDIGFAYDMWSEVTLYEGEPGTWYAMKPAICQLILTDARKTVDDR
ncbi:PHB depolymerase family esterase [Pistricoccus aurantiacus]|uniref:PHB depolymerase family esterase n=1 Tax=Pistricoccus aurantiacus TaxID=1883414 RepID=A0A5B8SNQ0_9GAMM|nr:PHB depolymerase family esterase [Pistricoccus aurantiacus]QEA37824.1 PHB depolymerase family esterase [Pistricoccus aurantiacus]